ncbi:glycosyltransferase family A protein [Microbacterium luticocti]|uniref:glycosyltransferase family A protein n=1 Tax=Microbacterium luticocti TaxID=451764 RepID=UPI0009FF252A|nr:glycosyltransferase family A protein [Microbacterium luticocti]
MTRSANRYAGSTAQEGPVALVIDVTVVVPTYRSTSHLDDLVASLDGQTLPQDRLEVLLIDDGSPDDTADRLRAFAGDRPNYRVIVLEPSGWPSRPRNVGIEQARGEYVVFIDHDDRLFPDALRAACALARRTGADVLEGKESKSNTPCWAMRDVPDDVENAIDWIDPHPLLPMNPHKMFRTAFLRSKGIRFPEGGRQIWEDISFDIAAHARAQVVSLMVSTPFYYWNRPAHRTTSGTFHDDLDEYLAAVARVFGWIDDELDQPRFAQLLPRFRAYQLHMRVLPLFRWSERTPAQRERIRAFTAELLSTIPDDADVHLDPWRRIKTALLRAGRFDLVDAHERTFPGIVCTPTASAPRWSPAGVRADVDLQWRFTAPDGPPVRMHDGRAVLALHPEVAAFAAAHGLSTDVTAALRAVTYSVDRRSRAHKVDWLVAHRTGAELVDVDGAAELRASLPIAWDLADDGPGRRYDGPWDLYVRTVVMRTRSVRQVRTDATGHSRAIVQGTLVDAYRTQNGCLSLDVGATLRSIVDDARTHGRGESEPGGTRIVLEMPQVAVCADAEMPGRIVAGDGRVLAPCRLVAADGAARIEATLPPGVRRFAVVVGGVRSQWRFRLRRSGGIRAVPPRRRGAGLAGRMRAVPRRVWNRIPARLRKRFWIWRHRR